MVAQLSYVGLHFHSAPLGPIDGWGAVGNRSNHLTRALTRAIYSNSRIYRRFRQFRSGNLSHLLLLGAVPYGLFQGVPCRSGDVLGGRI